MSASGTPASQESVALVDLLGEFLNAPAVATPRAQRSRPVVIRAADLCLRGIAQVIFINQPLCGVLILAGMALQSLLLAVFALLGVAASTGWAVLTIDDRPGIDAGFYGYNGALVGAAAATFGQIDSIRAGPDPGAVRHQPLKAQADAAVAQELDTLFKRLDRDGDGRLSRVDLAGGLRAFEPAASSPGQWSDAVAEAERRLDVLEAIERLLHGLAAESDEQIDASQFAELMWRCRRLLRDRDRLLTYLQPISADSTQPIGRPELDRLLVSLGQSQLDDEEWTAVLRLTGARPLTWGELVDLMLIT